MMQNGTAGAATAAAVAKATIETLGGDVTKPEAKPEESGFKIEIAVCENIDRAVTTKGKGAPATYHVEVRFVPSPGAHSICFQGERFKERAKAEAEKTYVESVLKRSVLVKPKPLKERRRVKARKRSRKS